MDPGATRLRYFRRADTDARVPPNGAIPSGVLVDLKGLARWFFLKLIGVVNHRHLVISCVTASVMVRLLWVVLVSSSPASDFAWYYQRGLDIAEGQGYTVDGVPTAYWPIGYPAFLGAIFWSLGPNLLYAKLANILLYVGILYLAYAIARELFSSEFTGRLTLLLLAFYPNHIAYSSLVSTETLYLFLLLLGTAALVLRTENEIWKGISTGLIFGAACLVKPQTIFIPLLLILVLHLRRFTARRLVKMALAVYLMLGAVILPWTVRNYSIYDDLIYISNNGGVTLFIGNNPYASGTYVPFEGKLKSLLALDPGDDEHDVDVKARKYAVDYMLEHPARTLSLCAIKLYYVYREDVEGVKWNEPATIWNEGHEEVHGAIGWFLVGVAQNYYLCTMAAFVLSLIVLFFGAGPGKVPTLGLWLIAYFSLIYSVTIGISRFHFPLMPWILMYVACLLGWTASRLGIDPVLPSRESENDHQS